jgi:uncharacterized protein
MLTGNRSIKVLSLTNQALIADKCIEANSFLTRLQGLIGRKSFKAGEGMLFPKCNDIHMWFMSVSLDVLFLKRDRDLHYRVVSVRAGVRPWRLLPLHNWKASDTLELPVGTIERCGIKEGDRLCIE